MILTEYDEDAEDYEVVIELDDEDDALDAVINDALGHNPKSLAINSPELSDVAQVIAAIKESPPAQVNVLVESPTVEVTPTIDVNVPETNVTVQSLQGEKGEKGDKGDAGQDGEKGSPSDVEVKLEKQPKTAIIKHSDGTVSRVETK